VIRTLRYGKQRFVFYLVGINDFYMRNIVVLRVDLKDFSALRVKQKSISVVASLRRLDGIESWD